MSDGAGGPSPAEPVELPPPPWLAVTSRRPKRTDRLPLDRERIVQAGLRIVDAEGADALSLRRLASDLDVAAMSVYWHVRDKAQLFDLIGEAVLETIEVPAAAAGGDWVDELRAIHRGMFGMIARHPNAVDLVIGRARYGPAGLRLFERILAALLGAGFTPTAAFDAYESLYLFTLGFAATATRTPEFVEIQRQGAAYMQSLPPAAFPAIRAVAPAIGGHTLDERFEVGLDVVLAG
ncbi:MAG TPA: TetR/AcrR family transcriptional regulator C-terminal domain-containing protein, partial [Candidatus Limnocylindrales bacterium]